MRLLLAGLLFCASGVAATLIRMACGGPGGVDAEGNVWQADIQFATKPQWNTAGALPIPYNHLRFSDPPGSSFSYSFQPGPGQYSVKLLFVEPNKTFSGQRVFSVAINGVPVLTNLDLFAVAGVLKPKDYTFPVTSSTGTLIIAFSPSAGNAVVSGIQVDGSSPPIAPVLSRGFLSERPACPGPVDFYHATDARALFWCDTEKWVQLNFPNATMWNVTVPEAEAKDCLVYAQPDAPGVWVSRCQGRFTAAQGLFDSTPGLFDAR